MFQNTKVVLTRRDKEIFWDQKCLLYVIGCQNIQVSDCTISIVYKLFQGLTRLFLHFTLKRNNGLMAVMGVKIWWLDLHLLLQSVSPLKINDQYYPETWCT